MLRRSYQALSPHSSNNQSGYEVMYSKKRSPNDHIKVTVVHTFFSMTSGMDSFQTNPLDLSLVGTCAGPRRGRFGISQEALMLWALLRLVGFLSWSNWPNDHFMKSKLQEPLVKKISKLNLTDTCIINVYMIHSCGVSLTVESFLCLGSWSRPNSSSTRAPVLDSWADIKVSNLCKTMSV